MGDAGVDPVNPFPWPLADEGDCVLPGEEVQERGGLMESGIAS